MKQRNLEGNYEYKKEFCKTKSGTKLYRKTLSIILTLYYTLSNLVGTNLAAEVTNYRVISAKVFRESFRGCKTGRDGYIIMNWFKASGFDYFDEIDSTFLGTGVIRAKKGQGCRSVTPNQWYWMAFVSTRISSTHCEMKAMLRETTAFDQGTCTQASAGVSVWDALFPNGVLFQQDNQVSFPSSITVGYGQEYEVTHGDDDMDGKDWGWLVYGMRYWNEVTPVYISHISVQMVYSFIPDNKHLSFKDVYNRITQYEQIGMTITHIPFRFQMRETWNGIPGITSYGNEFIINKLEDLVSSFS